MSTLFRLILAIMLIFAVACNEEDNSFESHGVITGQDYRMCVCCGGWLITIDDKQFQFNNLPENSGIDLSKEKFPLAVKLDWELNTTGCPNTITIQRIEKE